MKLTLLLRYLIATALSLLPALAQEAHKAVAITPSGTTGAARPETGARPLSEKDQVTFWRRMAEFMTAKVNFDHAKEEFDAAQAAMKAIAASACKAEEALARGESGDPICVAIKK